MNYVCNCGASLKYSSKDQEWRCPMGHPVYLCKKCKESNKIIPLQWIQQYQQWYCYECKEYTKTAEAVEAEKKVDEAIETLKRTVGLDPRNADAYYNLGVAYCKKGLIDQAITACERSIELNPNNSDAHNNLGSAYDKKDCVDKAIIEFKRAIEINPDAADAHRNLGIAYNKKGLSDQAVIELKRALDLKPDDAQTHVALSLAFCRVDRIDSAWAHARIAGTQGLATEELDQLIKNLMEAGTPTAEMYLFRRLKKVGERLVLGDATSVDYEAEATPLLIDRSELKERSTESKLGFGTHRDMRYYVVLVDNLTGTLWIWDQTQVKGMSAKMWTFSHRDADLPHDLIAKTLGRDELTAYKYRQIFRGNEPPEFWDTFTREKI